MPSIINLAQGRILSFLSKLPDKRTMFIWLSVWLVATALAKWLHWMAEFTVPAAGQRYETRSILFRQMMQLPPDCDLLAKWPPGACGAADQGSSEPLGGGGGVAQGLGIRLFAFGGGYWRLATAHSDPLWVRTCFGGVSGAPG